MEKTGFASSITEFQVSTVEQRIYQNTSDMSSNIEVMRDSIFLIDDISIEYSEIVSVQLPQSIIDIELIDKPYLHAREALKNVKSDLSVELTNERD